MSRQISAEIGDRSRSASAYLLSNQTMRPTQPGHPSVGSVMSTSDGYSHR